MTGEVYAALTCDCCGRTEDDGFEIGPDRDDIDRPICALCEDCVRGECRGDIPDGSRGRQQWLDSLAASTQEDE